MLYGITPFIDYPYDQNRLMMRVLELQYTFPKTSTDKVGEDLISSILLIDPSKRIGCKKNGADDIKNHKWFEGVDWDAIYQKKVQPPWLPKVKSTDDLSYYKHARDRGDYGRPYKDDGSNWDKDF